MYKNKTFLGIIPARGGSKRLPKKNILDLNGKPLIGWSIEAGLNSQYIDEVIVSSDDDDILKISKGFGANVIKRPVELASDTATTFDAIEHVIKNVKKYDYIVLLQPTSPLRTSKHVDEAIEIVFKKDAKAIVSVCETEHSPLWSNILPHDNSMDNFLTDSIINKRSQDIPIYYRLNGALYIYKCEKLLEEKKLFFNDKIFAFKMNKKESIDIDDIYDFNLAKCLMSLDQDI